MAAQAQVVAGAVTADEAPLLIAAAWLHDIGYASTLRDSGFHPLDGARYLRSVGWPPEVYDLVAHHSGSRFVAAVRHLDSELGAFRYTQDPLSDALTVADQTAGPDGQEMTVEERMTDMLSRHGQDSPNALAHASRAPYLREAARRVTARLAATGVGTTCPASSDPDRRPAEATRSSRTSP